MNNITVSGNLGKDPTVDDSGKSKRAKSSVAVWQGKDKPPCWIYITAWDKEAHSLAQCKRGDRVVVNGRLGSYTFERDGETRTVYDINVYNLYKCARLDHGGSAAPPTPEDDIPF